MLVGVGVFVGVAVLVDVAVLVGVGIGVLVAVGVGVLVAVGKGPITSIESSSVYPPPLCLKITVWFPEVNTPLIHIIIWLLLRYVLTVSTTFPSISICVVPPLGFP